MRTLLTIALCLLALWVGLAPGMAVELRVAAVPSVHAHAATFVEVVRPHPCLAGAAHAVSCEPRLVPVDIAIASSHQSLVRYPAPARDAGLPGTMPASIFRPPRA